MITVLAFALSTNRMYFFEMVYNFAWCQKFKSVYDNPQCTTNIEIGVQN